MAWLESSPESGVQSCRFHDVAWAGSFSMPSHQMSVSPCSSRTRATLVNSEFPRAMVRIAFGLVFQFVPGATPKNPDSGFTA